MFCFGSGVGGQELSTLNGVVLRPPAQNRAAPTVARYRSRQLSKSEGPEVNCQCNPGLFSVVWLTADSLPPVEPPDTVPKIAQKEKRFEPSVLAVSVGTEVSFPNLDPFYHNVFSYSKPARFDLGRYPQGETKTVVFEHPGIVKIFCEIHFSMRAYVHVLETPYFATSDENGGFAIDNIKPGEYTLRVWQENLPALERSVRIAGDSVFVEIE